MPDLWIIERRNPDGTLDLKGAQPESVFGMGAIKGMTDWQMSRIIFARNADCTLAGATIPRWPGLINPAWTARRKAW